MAWSAKEFEIFGVTGSTGNTESIRTTVEQVGHTLTVGEVVYRTTTGYTAAQADAASTSRVVGVVETVNGNEVTIVFQGIIDFTGSGVSVSDGQVYWLDGNFAGGFTAGAPTVSTHINKPMMVGISTNKALVVNALSNSSDGAGGGTANGLYVPIGTVMPYAGIGSGIPANWFLCAGDALTAPREIDDAGLSADMEFYDLYIAVEDNHRVPTLFNDGGNTGTGTLVFDNETIADRPSDSDRYGGGPGANGFHSLKTGHIFKIMVNGSESEVEVTGTGASSATVAHRGGATFATDNSNIAADMYGYVTGGSSNSGYTGNIFFLPDLRSRFIVGAHRGSGRTLFTLGTAGGAEDVTLTIDQIPAHTHDVTIGGSALGAAYSLPSDVNRNDTDTLTSESTGGDASHTNLPPYHGVNYIIRWNAASGAGIEVGPAGPAGRNGINGSDGATGPEGPRGAVGNTGSTGSTGSTGPTGATGVVGDVYVDGSLIFSSPENLGFSGGSNITLSTSTPSGINTITIDAASSSYSTPLRYGLYNQSSPMYLSTDLNSGLDGTYDGGASGFTGIGVASRYTEGALDLGLALGATHQIDSDYNTVRWWITLDGNLAAQGSSNYKLYFNSSTTGFQKTNSYYDFSDAATFRYKGLTAALIAMQTGVRDEHVDVIIEGNHTSTRTISTKILSERFNIVGATASSASWCARTPIDSGAIIGNDFDITGNSSIGYTAQIHVSDSGTITPNTDYVVIRPEDYPNTIDAETRAKLSGCFEVVDNDTGNELLTIRFPYFGDDMPAGATFPRNVTLVQNVLTFSGAGLSYGFHVKDGETLNIGMALGTASNGGDPVLSGSKTYPEFLVIKGPNNSHFVGIKADRGSSVNIGPNVFIVNCGKGLVADNASSIRAPFGGFGVLNNIEDGISIDNASTLSIGPRGGSQGVIIYGNGSAGVRVTRGSSLYSDYDGNAITTPSLTGVTFGALQFIAVGNSGSAFVCSKASSADIKKSFIHKNGGNGVELVGNSYVRLSDAYIGENTKNGIYADMVSSADVSGSNITGHSGNGTGSTGYFDANVNFNSIVIGGAGFDNVYTGYGATASVLGLGGVSEL